MSFLASLVLSIVDFHSHGCVVVEGLGYLCLAEFVLDGFFQAIVQEYLKRIIFPFSEGSELA